MFPTQDTVFATQEYTLPHKSRTSDLRSRRVPLQVLSQPSNATDSSTAETTDRTIKSKCKSSPAPLLALDIENLRSFIAVNTPLPSPEAISAFDFGLSEEPGFPIYPSESSKCHHSNDKPIDEIDLSDFPPPGSRRPSTKSTYSLFPTITTPTSTRASTPHRDSLDSIPISNLRRPSAVRLRSSTVGTSISSDIATLSSSSGITHYRSSTTASETSVQSRWSDETITQPLLDYDTGGSYFTPFLCSPMALPQTPYRTETPDAGRLPASRRTRQSRGCFTGSGLWSCIGRRPR